MSHSREVVLISLLGGVLAGSTALFLSTPRGRQMRRDVTDSYDEYKEKVEDFVEDVQDRTGSFTRGVNDNLSDWTTAAKDVMDLVNEEIDYFTDPRSEEMRKGLLIGILCGGLCGVGSALLISRQEKEDLSTKLGSQVTDLKKFLLDLQAVRSGRCQKACSEHRTTDVVNDVLDLANVGLQLWGHLKRRR